MNRSDPAYDDADIPPTGDLRADYLNAFLSGDMRAAIERRKQGIEGPAVDGGAE